MADTNEYDLLIVGGGLAGLTAAMYGGRFGLRTAIIEPMASGGQVLNVERIENYPGFPHGVAGFDLGPLVQEQVEAAGAEYVLDTATRLEIRGDRRVVHCDGQGELVGRAVIVAAGSSLRSLGIPGESAFLGRGVSHCASCDAPFFVGRDVCVVGGGDSAIDEALVLAEQVGRVVVIHRGPALARAQAVGLRRLEDLPNVEVLLNTELVEIGGGETVGWVGLRSGGGQRRAAEEAAGATATLRREVSGVFVFVGLEPNTAFVRGILALDATGHVQVDAHLQTSVPGVFAAGDIRQGSARQLVAAAGDGASAAVAAARLLRGT